MGTYMDANVFAVVLLLLMHRCMLEVGRMLKKSAQLLFLWSSVEQLVQKVTQSIT